MNTLRKKTQMQLVWEQVQTTPLLTTAQLAAKMGIQQCNISSAMTQMVRRKMVEPHRYTFINENARKQTIYRYVAIGTKYEVKPLVIVPVKPRKCPTKNIAVQQEIVFDAPAQPALVPEEPERLMDEPWHPMATPTPPQPAFDIESMTVRQARDLYAQLGEFFGGAK